MFKKFKNWLFATEIKGFTVDNFENEIERKLVSAMKKTPVKKAAAKKKAPTKKAPVKKTAPKKTTKKTTKKK